MISHLILFKIGLHFEKCRICFEKRLFWRAVLVQTVSLIFFFSSTQLTVFLTTFNDSTKLCQKTCQKIVKKINDQSGLHTLVGVASESSRLRSRIYPKLIFLVRILPRPV